MPGNNAGAGQAPPARVVDHIVVLMMENHSFDHLLGFLEHPHPAVGGLQPGSYWNVDRNGTRIGVTKDGEPCGIDPDHSYEGVKVQLEAFGGTANGGFIRSYDAQGASEDEARRVMQCLDPEVHCRVLGTLAKEFAVCPWWHCSVRGATWPNRNFAHAATSDAESNIAPGFYHDRTIFELIAEAGASWHIYYDGTPQVWCFPRLWRPRVILDFLLRREPKIGNWYQYQRFREHVRHNKLASYSFIEPAHNRFYSKGPNPRQTNSQHPHNNCENGADFAAGERLIRDVYEILRSNPAVFERTLLLITYDEHGGLWDHVPPPDAVPPGDVVSEHWSRRAGRFLARTARLLQRKPIAKEPDDYKRYGVRVPAVIVSPWIKEETVLEPPDGKSFDHASIPATLRACFGRPRQGPLTERDGAAPTFHHLVTASPLLYPRPNPGEDNAHKLRPLPDLSKLTPHVAGPPQPPEAVTARSPGELDEELFALERRVRRWLQWSPAGLIARIRTHIRPARGQTRAAIRGARLDTPELFADTARAIRGE